MQVKIKLFNQLRDYAPDQQTVFFLELSKDASISALLKRLNIPSSVQKTLLVNGRRVDGKDLLSPGDEVVLMSPLEGG